MIAQDYRAGTSKLYSRGDFLASPYGHEAFDTGDFIGRLRTLYGPQPGNEYVLRHKATGFVVTAYSGASGPSFGGGPRYFGALPAPDHLSMLPPASDPAAILARRAADPVIAAGDPSQELATRPADAALGKRIATYNRHMADADAPVGMPPIVARLDALLESVPPADWEETGYDEDSVTVSRAGAAGGHSFAQELAPAQAIEFLLAEAEHEHLDPEVPLAWSANLHALYYFQPHADELASYQPRVRDVWQRFATTVKARPASERTLLADALRDLAPPLHLTGAQVDAALR